MTTPTDAYEALRLERLHTAPPEAQDDDPQVVIGRCIREICRLLDEDTQRRARERRQRERGA